MSRHDPSNANCDKVRYHGAPDVLCTCDVDSADDLPAPSTVMPAGPLAPDPSGVTLVGEQASNYLRLQASTRRLKSAQDAFRDAEAAWRSDLDRFQAEMLR